MRADAQRNRARILDAAEQVFTSHGVSASTEDVASLAGVAIGTVFRHFPTKNDLLSAIMKQLLERLIEDVAALRLADERGQALFTFFTRMVEQAAAKKAVVDLLAQTGVEIQLTHVVGTLSEGIGELLEQAQAAGTVGAHIELPEVMALLTSTCQGALHASWSPTLQQRTLSVVFAGLASPTIQASI